MAEENSRAQKNLKIEDIIEEENSKTANTGYFARKWFALTTFRRLVHYYILFWYALPGLFTLFAFLLQSEPTILSLLSLSEEQVKVIDYYLLKIVVFNINFLHMDIIFSQLPYSGYDFFLSVIKDHIDGPVANTLAHSMVMLEFFIAFLVINYFYKYYSVFHRYGMSEHIYYARKFQEYFELLNNKTSMSVKDANALKNEYEDFYKKFLSKLKSKKTTKEKVF
jgi:hypothetical protein